MAARDVASVGCPIDTVLPMPGVKRAMTSSPVSFVMNQRSSFRYTPEAA